MEKNAFCSGPGMGLDQFKRMAFSGTLGQFSKAYLDDVLILLLLNRTNKFWQKFCTIFMIYGEEIFLPPYMEEKFILICWYVFYHDHMFII